MLKNSGIGTQVFQVLKLLVKEKSIDLTLIGSKNDISETLSGFTGKVINWHPPIYSLKEQLFFPNITGFLHSPHYNAPLRHLKRTIVVVHDLIHLQSKEFNKPHHRIYANFLLKNIARHARHIVTVSEYTKQELIKSFPAAENKTTVIHNGLNENIFKKQSPAKIKLFRKKYSLPEKYFLTVGIGKKHKNIDFIIRALAPLWKSGKLSVPLVLGGTGGKIPDYVNHEIRKQDVVKFIYVMPFLEDTELPLLYASADLFFMPSLIEGFGFPVIEAMACGTPVLCSSTSSLPEIAGNAAAYFDPCDEQSFRDIFIKIQNSRTNRNSLINKGFKQSKKYSWKNHVRSLVEIYERL